MESKSYYENIYQVNYDCAMKYAQQSNLPEAKASLQKAGNALCKLVEMTYGVEREKYKAKIKGVLDILEKVNTKMNEVPVKPAVNNTSGATAKTQPKEAKQDAAPKEKIPVEQALATLNELIGLNEVKKEVETLTAELEMKMLRDGSAWW